MKFKNKQHEPKIHKSVGREDTRTGEGNEGGGRTQKTKEKICFCLFSEMRKKSEVTKRGVQEKEKPERH